MAISTPSAGTRREAWGAGAVEALTQSTATALQTLSVTTYVSSLGAGTATGTMARNVYVLPATAPDGTEKIVILGATGEASLTFTMATCLHYIGRDTAGVASATNVAVAIIGAATGGLVLNTTNSWVKLMAMNSSWIIVGGNATFGTTT